MLSLLMLKYRFFLLVFTGVLAVFLSKTCNRKSLIKRFFLFSFLFFFFFFFFECSNCVLAHSNPSDIYKHFRQIFRNSLIHKSSFIYNSLMYRGPIKLIRKWRRMTTPWLEVNETSCVVLEFLRFFFSSESMSGVFTQYYSIFWRLLHLFPTFISYFCLFHIPVCEHNSGPSGSCKLELYPLASVAS